MTVNKADIEAMAKQIRYDLSVTRTRIDELMEAVASLPMPEEPDQFLCGLCLNGFSFASERRLNEHLENVHGEVIA